MRWLASGSWWFVVVGCVAGMAVLASGATAEQRSLAAGTATGSAVGTGAFAPRSARVVNLDASTRELELVCGESLWRAPIGAGQTAKLGGIGGPGCRIEVVGSAHSVWISADTGDMEIRDGLIQERVPSLAWSPVRPAAGYVGSWPADTASQWATRASASSEYTTTQWSAMQATGPPNVPQCGDHPNAWATREARSTEPEYIELRFAKRVRARGARLHVTLTPGAVVEVQALAGKNWETVWSGSDPTSVCPAVFVVKFSEEVDTDSLRVVLDTSNLSNWFELDAVELLGAPL